MRDGVMARINGAGGPGERTEDQNGSTDEIDALGAAEVRGAYEQSDTRKAENEPDENPRTGPNAPRAKPIDNHHPKRNSSHEQRSDARGDAGFSPGKRSITAQQQEKASDDGGSPLRGRGLFFALVTEERIENQPD